MKFPSWPNPSGYRDIELGLSRVFDLLARLDNPHLKIPPTIHIAGTNGKGSTLSFLRAIFVENGFKIHAYTSPHLVNFNERIILNNSEISDDFLNEILSECKKAAEISPAIPVTFFEGITVAAFLAFSRVKADLLLLETGLGGRLDATNVLPKVLCSIITPIDFDHEDFLGKTLAKIAFEKAGIIKKNSLLIVGKQKAEAKKVIVAQAQKMNAEIKIFDRDFSAKKLGITKNNLSLLGSHQIENATVASACALSLQQFKIPQEKIISALKKAFWPARLQKINSGNFFKKIPKSSELFLDGSHNLQGAQTVLKFLKSQKNKKIFVIFSMLKDKNCEGFLEKISDEIDQLITLEISDEPKSRSANEIKNIAQKIGIKTEVAKNFADAFEKIKCDEPALILICGSLYLAGEFLEKNHP